MGFGSLAASPFNRYGLREPLKISGLLALDARDPDQIPDDPGIVVAADTADVPDDPAGIKGDRRGHPTAAGAELIGFHLLQGRPGDLCKLFLVMWTAAFVHGSITRQKVKLC